MKKKEYEIIISPEAESELNTSKKYYEDKQVGLGKDFVNEVDTTIEKIGENPSQFPKVNKKNIRKANVNRFPFAIYFAIKEQIINILAVFHSNRNPEQLN